MSKLKLRPYQVTGAKFLASRKRAANFDDMGLGKTIQALFACWLVKAKTVLVICPAGLQLNWHDENEKLQVPIDELVTASFNYIQKDFQAKALSQVRWDVIIIDESHRFKNWQAKQTINFVKIVAKSTKRLWLLSGSPATNSAADYHVQLSLMLPGQLGSFGDWKERHCDQREVGFGRYARTIVEGFKNERRINKILRKVSIRRTRKQVLKELPPVRFSDLYLDVDYEEDISDEYAEEALQEDRPPLNILPELRALGFAKAQAAKEYIRDFQEPLIIWLWFKDAKEYLADVVLKHRTFGILSGKESAKKKYKTVRAFQEGKIDFLIGQIAAGAEGHTLTRAKTCLFLEYTFSPALYDQAWSRLHRMGQRRGVHVINSVVKESLDQKILQKLKKKAKGMRACLGE